MKRKTTQYTQDDRQMLGIDVVIAELTVVEGLCLLDAASQLEAIHVFFRGVGRYSVELA